MLELIYRWKDGAQYSKLDPQEVGEVLDAIADDNDGALEPEHVVEAARPKRSPLHACFEWNDKKAATEHRLTQARSLIRSVTVVYREATEEETEGRTRAYQIVKRGTKQYRGIYSVMSDVEQRNQLLRAALRELQTVRLKYRGIAELAGIFEVIDKSTADAENAAE